jgi:uncharacterized protein YndB with AHSA1/START domain
MAESSAGRGRSTRASRLIAAAAEAAYDAFVDRDALLAWLPPGSRMSLDQLARWIERGA